MPNEAFSPTPSKFGKLFGLLSIKDSSLLPDHPGRCVPPRTTDCALSDTYLWYQPEIPGLMLIISVGQKLTLKWLVYGEHIIELVQKPHAEMQGFRSWPSQRFHGPRSMGAVPVLLTIFDLT
jgi:hypothetical protein